MKRRPPHKNILRLIVLITLACLVLLFFLKTMFVIFLEVTDKNFSITQSWKEYFSLEDWNLSGHAIVDVDNDGKKDMVTFTNCAFLSTISAEKIPIQKQCEEPSMSTIAFPDNATTVGQKLSSQTPFHYQWLKKSYLVKTKNNVWKFYDMNGIFLRTYELGNDHLFTEVKPTFLDIIDTFAYQINHLGVTLLLFVLP